MMEFMQQMTGYDRSQISDTSDDAMLAQFLQEEEFTHDGAPLNIPEVKVPTPSSK